MWKPCEVARHASAIRTGISRGPARIGMFSVNQFPRVTITPFAEQ
jgi:hypothetical protein